MTGPGRPARRAGINPAEAYEALGPITPDEARNLTRMSPGERNRWFGNIYGPATSGYARTQYTAMTRKQP